MPGDREEHLAWCKRRALDYLDRGELENACVSMASDLTAHPECTYPDFLLALGIIYVSHADHAGLRRWIEGFR